jgi:hypothetical protein
MSESVLIIDYTGPVDFKKIDLLLRKVKKMHEFTRLHKTTGKRVYAIMVECLENIARYAAKSSAGTINIDPFMSVNKESNNVIIKAGNLISNDRADELKKRLDHINELNEEELLLHYEKKINKEPESSENGAGLGFMLMRLKSGNKISFSLTRIDDNLTFFEILISVNKYIMRKLIINQTSSSPKVILDPDKNIFEISGESRPPDVAGFYEEVLSWLDDYSVYLTRSHAGTDPLVFNFDFEYFNSSSAKYILDFCKQIGNVRSKGKNIEVKWHYEDDDMDMLEVGREMSRMAKFPFEYIQKDIK